MTMPSRTFSACVAVTIMALLYSAACADDQECYVEADCPGAGPCAEATCTEGQCGIKHLPEGSLALNEQAGDCKRWTCDGSGNMVISDNNGDVPNDGFLCTYDRCANGYATFEFKPALTSCGLEGEYCHEDGRCDACPDVSCTDPDPYEPNETWDTAWDFGAIQDIDTDGDVICGVINGASDVDWFRYDGADKPFSWVDPTQAVSSGAVRLCVYFLCDDNENTIAPCPDGTTEKTTEFGARGCCSERGGDFTVDLWCGVTNPYDNSRVWISIESRDADICAPYELRYHY